MASYWTGLIIFPSTNVAGQICKDWDRPPDRGQLTFESIMSVQLTCDQRKPCQREYSSCAAEFSG